MSLRVSEMFYSLQGEGPTTGVPAVFLRLGGCNLLCGGMGTIQDKELHDGATWRCDTIEVWSQARKLSKEDLYQEFLDRKFLTYLTSGAHLVITGGEPLQQQEEILEFLNYYKKLGLPLPYIEIETNGTIAPCTELFDFVDQFNISPKLSNSGMPEERRLVPMVIRQLIVHRNSFFKFVVSSIEDVREAERDFILAHPFSIRRSQIVLMPGADNRAKLQELEQQIAAIAIERGYRYSSRLHIQIWDKKTGV